MDFIDSAAKKAANIFNDALKRYILTIRPLTNPLYQRWAIAILLCIVLSVILAPEIHVFTPKYEIGTISTHDIKADRDFLVEDQESTRQKKLDAGENIKSVYDYDGNLTAAIQGKIAKAFDSIEEFRQNIPAGKTTELTAFNNQEVRKLKKNLDTNFGFSLAPEEFYALMEQKDPEGLKQKINLFVTSFYENRYITATSFTKGEKEKGIILRDIKTHSEEILSDINQVLNIKAVDTLLEKNFYTIFSKDNQGLKRAMLSLSKKLTEPNLTFNKETTEKKKTAAIDEVKPVFFQVQKNEMIVREGEKITATEKAKLEAFFKAAGDNRFSSLAVLLGIFFTSLFFSLVMYFWRTRNWLKNSRSSNIDILVFGLLIILQIVIVKIGIFISGALNRALPFISMEACYFAIPFAMGSMIMAILINRNVALITSVMTSFLIGFLFDEKLVLPIYSFLGAVAASHHIVNSRNRSTYLKIGIFLGIINMTAIFCLNLVSGNFLNDLFWRLLMGFIGGILTGVLVAGITPIFESLFGFMTEIKLLELANLNQPIFQKMIIEAPGTYHHSIIVASLVEAASEAIGTDSVLAKVSAYYHDIGKLKKPQYFIENQPSNENKHDKLSPKMSSLIIISHVKDGCELAQEAKLGRKIINIIRESHGTSIVSYFYNKAKKDKDESIRSLSEDDFRYPGPKPQTKEAGLVMLGDVVEASSRTLTNPTPARIRSLVRERIGRIYADGQLDDCELTLKNLNTIAETFTRILTGIFHHRIDYAEHEQKEGNGRKESNENTNRKQSEELQTE